eukprot:4980142-Lingulodinium_polyedra.AAC.1
MSTSRFLVTRIAGSARPPNTEPPMNEQGVLRREGARIGVNVRHSGRDTRRLTTDQRERTISRPSYDLPEMFRGRCREAGGPREPD